MFQLPRIKVLATLMLDHTGNENIRENKKKSLIMKNNPQKLKNYTRGLKAMSLIKLAI
jgi:hypothetical protein